MSNPMQQPFTVPRSAIDRAARLIEAMTADPATTDPGDDPWTVEDVIAAALARGLDALEKTYGPERASGEDPRVTYARDTLAYWERGDWANAPRDLANPMAGHLAGALRALLAFTGEDNGPAGSGVGQS